MWLFFLLSCVFFSCSNNPELVKEFAKIQTLPIEEIEGAEMFQTENGNLKVKIIAETITRFKDTTPELFFSNGVKVIFYNDSGLVNSVLTAFNAQVDEFNNIMIATDNVVLKSSSGEKMQSEEIIWNQNIKKIYTDKKVFITTEKEFIEGTGFESNADFSEYSISHIQGTFNFQTLAE